MIIIKRFFTMGTLAFLMLAMTLAVLPIHPVHAADLNDQTDPPDTTFQVDNSRLETLWAKELRRYEKAVSMLDRVNDMTSRVQELINIANGKGWDTSSVQSALDAFIAAARSARPIINSANGIVTSHKGFDANGKVTDRTQAIETVKELGQRLKDARVAMGGSGKVLREAVKAFRAAHKPEPTNP